MGLFDLPSPLFAWLDHALGAVAPATARLVLWGILAAVLSMALYRLLSPQGRIAATKAQVAEARRAMDAYDGDFSGAKPLIGKMLRLAFRQIGLVLGPSAAAGVPVLCLIVWLATAYGYGYPAMGAGVVVDTMPQGLQTRWIAEGEPRSQPAASPAQTPHIVVADEAGHIVGEVALRAPVPIVHKRQWWNLFFGNPAGYLPENGDLERIELALPRREYLSFGPDWLRGWEAVFFTALLAGSLAIKIGLRIE